MTYEFRSIRGVRVDRDKVIISMKGGKKYANSNARAVCAAIMEIWGGPKAALFTSEPTTQWDDPRVQAVYEILCAIDDCPPPGQHWEGWTARRIVDALSAPQAEPAPATADFLHRTNQEYAAWCSTFYGPEALDGNGRRSLHGLWAWQEQERRKVAAAPKAAPAETVAKISGFEAMADGDLIMCVNLLHADALDYEQMGDEPEHQAILRECAAIRRALAARMKAEVDRRSAKRRDQTT